MMRGPEMRAARWCLLASERLRQSSRGRRLAVGQIHCGRFGSNAKRSASRGTDSRHRGRGGNLGLWFVLGLIVLFCDRQPVSRGGGRRGGGSGGSGLLWFLLGMLADSAGGVRRRLGRLGGGGFGGGGDGGGFGDLAAQQRRRRRFRKLVARDERNGCEMLSTETKLTELVNRLKEFAGANLECVILFGSAARGDFREGHSDLNVVCILHSLSVEELDASHT